MNRAKNQLIKSSLVYVKYSDHVLFRNADSSSLRPCVREVVGWLIRETNEVLYICHERAVELLPFEKPSESGFIVLKSDVLEKRNLIFSSVSEALR